MNNMKKKFLNLFAIAIIGVLVSASCSEIEELDRQVDEMHLNNLKDWVVNGSTSEKAIAQFGYENCFKVLPLQDYYWEDYQNSQHDATATMNRSDLMSVRSLVYCGTSMSPLKTGEIICNKTIANDLLAIFRALYEAKYNVDAVIPLFMNNYQSLTEQANASSNNTFCFHFMGTPLPEAHVKGLAVVLNPYTPPTTDDLAVKLFKQYGFTWGGDSADGKRYYFEKKE